VDPDEARARFATAHVARLATVGVDEQPHLVPITFALIDDETIVTAVDGKPKRTTNLKRIRNIERNPNASVLVDHYEDDWSQLWWARADGIARIIPTIADDPAARAALSARYPQYQDQAPDNALIVIEVRRWSGWAAT
jgi:PPOX class probable F420-dependent enzyme